MPTSGWSIGCWPRPRYGERWATPWLDAARYADSNGYQRDGHRTIWPYRDWVIRALNADMPFDQFTIEQIAGDLLPDATLDQQIATGFHRCTTVNVEAGTDEEENRTNQVIDRVNVTGTVWLGTTLECCQCHNHKYDPFTQRDYYQFFAFFNNTPKETYQRTQGFGRRSISAGRKSSCRSIRNVAEQQRAKLAARQQAGRRRVGAVPGRRNDRPGRLGTRDGGRRQGGRGQAARQHPPHSGRRRRKRNKNQQNVIRELLRRPASRSQKDAGRNGRAAKAARRARAARRRSS